MNSSLDADRVLAWLDELIEHTCSLPPTLAPGLGKVFGEDPGEGALN